MEIYNRPRQHNQVVYLQVRQGERGKDGKLKVVRTRMISIFGARVPLEIMESEETEGLRAYLITTLKETMKGESDGKNGKK